MLVSNQVFVLFFNSYSIEKMNLIKYTSLAFIAITALTACKEKTTEAPAKVTPPIANVDLLFSNEVDGQALEFGQLKYTNAAGNLYQVDLLKYYVTNVKLVKADSTFINLENYDLINAADPSTCVVNGLNIPNGTYTKIIFNIGLPVDRNHTGAQDGDLEPAKGMIWDWNTGYVFFKHEGKYKNSSNQTKSLVFHFATDRALTIVEMPLSSPLVVNGVDKKVFLKFNLNKLYTTPSNVDFNVDYDRQSSSNMDFPWLDNLKLSFYDAFIFDRIE